MGGKIFNKHAFFLGIGRWERKKNRERERQIAGINANLYTIYSSGRLTYFFCWFPRRKNEINSTFCKDLGYGKELKKYEQIGT